MRSERFPVAGPIGLTVRLEAGEVHVETADVPEATVELEPLNGAARKAVDEARIRLDGAELLVEVGGWRLGRVRISVTVGRGPEVRATIRLPHGSRLRCDVVAADVTATGRYGEADVRTVSGDVRVGDVEGAGVFKSVSGDVEVQRVGGQANVNSVSGDVTVAELGGGAGAKTVSGDLAFESVGKGAIQAQSVSGDIKFGVRNGASLFVDASSVSGDTVSELELGEGPPEGQKTTLELRAKSVSGDIRIVRAAAR